MRFKAQLVEAAAFLNVLHVVDKLVNECLVHLTQNILYVYVAGDVAKGGEQAFFELSVPVIFEDYRIESKQNNEIAFTVSVSNLQRALRSSEKAEKIILRLTKKGVQPYLSFELGLQGLHIVQDVPIRLESQRAVEAVAEPVLPSPEVKFRMPDLGALSQVIERMRTVSDVLTIFATSQGDVCFQVKQPQQVEIRTFYRELQFEESTEPTREAQARLHIRKFEKTLHARLLSSTHRIGCIVPQHAFVLHTMLAQDAGTATFYIPLLASQD